MQLFMLSFGAAIFFGTDQRRGTAKMVQRSRFNIQREAHVVQPRCRRLDEPRYTPECATVSVPV
jgi:hypothetical protein